VGINLSFSQVSCATKESFVVSRVGSLNVGELNVKDCTAKMWLIRAKVSGG
jgi:hypothetical protein